MHQQICQTALDVWWDLRDLYPALAAGEVSGNCGIVGMRDAVVHVDLERCLGSELVDADWAVTLRAILAGAAPMRGSMLFCLPLLCVPESAGFAVGMQIFLKRHFENASVTGRYVEDISQALRKMMRDGAGDAHNADPECMRIESFVVLQTDWHASPLCCGGLARNEDEGECLEEHAWFRDALIRVSVGDIQREDVPGVLHYAHVPEFDRCPVASTVLKLHHLTNQLWAQPVLEANVVSRFEPLHDQILQFGWGDLIESGWGVIVFNYLNEIAMRICGEGRFPHEFQCGLEPGMPMPSGRLQENLEHGSALHQQLRWVAGEATSFRRHTALLAAQPVVAPIPNIPTRMAFAQLSMGFVDGVQMDIDTAQQAYIWHQSADTKSNIMQMFLGGWMLWAALGVLSLQRLVSQPPERVATLLFDRPCAACGVWAQRGEPGRRLGRRYVAVKPCAQAGFVPVALERLTLMARILGVSLAAVGPEGRRELEMMLDFYDPWFYSRWDVCAYRWDMDLQHLVCHFGRGYGATSAWSVVPGSTTADFSPRIQGGPVPRMVPGPPLVIGCAVPDGLELPFHVELRVSGEIWKRPLEADICADAAVDGEDVPEVAICTRTLHSLGGSPLLGDWLRHHAAMGIDKVFLYDADGSAGPELAGLPKGFVTYFPAWFSRDEREVTRGLSKRGAWPAHWNKWDPEMGCHMLQMNHCLMHARGRAKYVLWIRAPDKYFVPNLASFGAVASAFGRVPPLDFAAELVRHVEELAEESPAVPIAAAMVPTYDYFSPRPCFPESCVVAHQDYAAHALAGREDYLSLMDPGAVWGLNSHQAWPRDGTRRVAVSPERFWVAHYLRGFDTSPERQAAWPSPDRWRFRLCEQQPQDAACVRSRWDGSVAALFVHTRRHGLGGHEPDRAG